MRTLSKRGFTLIELLVVIAIIGILSAIVLASLGNARNKGSDAGVKTNLHSVASQAALYIDDNPTYGTYDDGSGGPIACPTLGSSGTGLFYDTTVESAIDSAIADSGASDSYCISSGSAYAVAVDRPGVASSGAWCTDSTGTSCGVATSSPITAGQCTLPCVSSD